MVASSPSFCLNVVTPECIGGKVCLTKALFPYFIRYLPLPATCSSNQYSCLHLKVEESKGFLRMRYGELRAPSWGADRVGSWWV